jgi:hypothetical protein
MASFVSEPIPLPGVARDLSRADVVFYGVDHSGPSFEALVFLNNPTATAETGREQAEGYVGSFFIFGHGGCAGDVGHCEVPSERRPFDWRPPHQLTPATRLVIVTESLRRLIQAGEETLVVSVVPIATRPPAESQGELLQIERVSLALYSWP